MLSTLLVVVILCNVVSGAPNKHETKGAAIVGLLNGIHSKQKEFIKGLTDHLDEEHRRADEQYKWSKNHHEGLVKAAQEEQYSAREAEKKALAEKDKAKNQFELADDEHEKAKGRKEAAEKAYALALQNQAKAAAHSAIIKLGRKKTSLSNYQDSASKACSTMLLLQTIYDKVTKLTDTTAAFSHTASCKECSETKEHCTKPKLAEFLVTK